MKTVSLLLASITSISAMALEMGQVKTAMKDGIRYLQETQVKETIGEKQFEGEWSSFMMNDNLAFLLGPKGKSAYDSNAFTTASVHNALANTYLSFPEYREIPSMLERAIQNVLLYKNNDRFGFWQLLPGHLDPSALMRRPNHYVLMSKFINNASNVPEDADDTAVAYLAMKLNHDVAEASGEFVAPAMSVEKIGPLFSEYRDHFRRTAHYYNIINGRHVFTGAFMTWMQKEPYFTPWSWLPLSHKKPYIPYGMNEVDCVVNSNVLGTLAHFNELDTKGVDRACKFIAKAVKRDNIDMCGVYYPNTFNLPYTAAKAFEAGATCLSEALPGIQEFVLKNQHDDGSFSYEAKGQAWKGRVVKVINSVYVNEPTGATEEERQGQREQNLPYDTTIDPKDTLQSTIYAVSGLLSMPTKGDAKVRDAIEKGIAYILSHSSEKNGQRYWRGGIFFAGGTLVRGDVRWRSDAYTTSLVVELLAKYRKHIEQSI